MKIYIGNLAPSISEKELKYIFSKFGEVASVNLIKDDNTGELKGFAFIEMPDNTQADEAIVTLNMSTFKGTSLKVERAK